MSNATSDPVMASNPVAKTMLSNSNSRSDVRTPRSVTSISGVLRRSINSTLGRLYVA